jgi:hypothetical protein
MGDPAASQRAVVAAVVLGLVVLVGRAAGCSWSTTAKVAIGLAIVVEVVLSAAGWPRSQS